MAESSDQEKLQDLRTALPQQSTRVSASVRVTARGRSALTETDHSAPMARGHRESAEASAKAAHRVASVAATVSTEAMVIAHSVLTETVHRTESAEASARDARRASAEASANTEALATGHSALTETVRRASAEASAKDVLRAASAAATEKAVHSAVSARSRVHASLSQRMAGTISTQIQMQASIV